MDNIDMSTVESTSCYSPSQSATSSPTPSHSSTGADDSGCGMQATDFGGYVAAPPGIATAPDSAYYQLDRCSPSLSPTSSQASADDVATSSAVYLAAPPTSHYCHPQSPQLRTNFGQGDLYDVLSDLHQWLV